MYNDFESLPLVRNPVQEEVDLSPRCPATWHNPRRRLSEAERARIVAYLRADHTTYPQRILRFFSKLLCRFWKQKPM